MRTIKQRDLSVATSIISIMTLLSIVHELCVTRCISIRNHIVINLILDSLKFKKFVDSVSFHHTYSVSTIDC